ncbi:MAG: alpha/beta fold hydrolase [Anaerolineae bacterium]|nr:alpha/beta fold hydrolase [Anaerolineae bacterium]
MSTTLQLRAISLVGQSRWLGCLVGLGLITLGAVFLPLRLVILLWVPLCGLLAFVVLLLGGSFIVPPPDPNQIFEPDHPAHGTSRLVHIPDGNDVIPGYLLMPSKDVDREAAVCLVHGAGDSKTSYKWLLIRALLAEGLTVLTIDLPGHGDYRHRVLTYPEVLTTIPAALRFLRTQAGVRQVGIIGISLGGAIAIRSLVEAIPQQSHLVDALVVLETPIQLDYSKALFYREMWRTLYGAPVLWLLREMSVKQAWDIWHRGGYRTRHTTSHLFALLDPLTYISRLSSLPILLVYSRRDGVAPPEHAQAMHQAAPQADFIETKKASHVVLTLMPEINRQVASWLKKQLVNKPA